jgi:hypothetical protein
MNKHDPLTWETHGATTQMIGVLFARYGRYVNFATFLKCGYVQKVVLFLSMYHSNLIQIFFSLSPSYTASNNCRYDFSVVSLSPSWYFSQTSLRVNTSDNFQHVITRRRSTLASTAMGNRSSYSKLQMPCDHCRCACRVPWNSKTILPTRTAAHYFIGLSETATTPTPHHPLSPRTAKTLRSIVPSLVETS